MADRTDIAKLLGILGVEYPRQALNAKQVAQAVPVWEALLGPPFVISRAEIDEVVAALREAIVEVTGRS
jgi:hypothetical protein